LVTGDDADVTMAAPEMTGSMRVSTLRRRRGEGDDMHRSAAKAWTPSIAATRAMTRSWRRSGQRHAIVDHDATWQTRLICRQTTTAHHLWCNGNDTIFGRDDDDTIHGDAKRHDLWRVSTTTPFWAATAMMSQRHQYDADQAATLPTT
jgi:hypothetical protein